VQLDRPIRVADGLAVVVISDNEVLVEFGTRSRPSELLRDEDLSGTVGVLFRRLLRGPASPTDLVGGLPDAEATPLLAAIEGLLDDGLLVDGQTSPTEQYLGYTHTGRTSLSALAVAIVGVGPIGMRVAHGLLQQGLGKLILLDEREADDAWHRLLPVSARPERAAGATVQEVAAAAFGAMGHADIKAQTSARGRHELQTAIAQADLTIVAFEQPSLWLNHLVNRYCLREGKPWLLLEIDGDIGRIGPLFVPPDTGCFNDYNTLAEAATAGRAAFDTYRQLQRDYRPSSFFVGLPAYADIVAGHGAMAATQFLLRGTSFAVERVMSINFDRAVIDVENVLKLPRCPVCGPQKRLYQPVFPAGLAQSA
jgi:bacteriocin biosynthesis cyclodehydratase domain-containing protein